MHRISQHSQSNHGRQRTNGVRRSGGINPAGLAAVALVAGLAPGLAMAEGFSSGYVTGFGSEDECMSVARDSMAAQFNRNGVSPDTGEATFSVFGWDVPPGQTQVAIVCSEDQGRVTATVTGYSLNEDGTRLDTVNSFLDLLEGNPPAGGSK